MTYSDTLRAMGDLKIAAPGLKCQGSTPYSSAQFTCAFDYGEPAAAVHTWLGRHYCGFHSPFDRTEAEIALQEQAKVVEALINSKIDICNSRLLKIEPITTSVIDVDYEVDPFIL